MNKAIVFTEKQKEFLKLASQNRLSKINILEGCVRSGKTFVSIPAWITAISRTPVNAKYVIAGKTLGSIETNILPVMEEIAPGSVKHTRKNNHATIFGRECILKGVYDKKAEDGIRGATFAGAYCDEITLYNQEFFDMLTTRLTMENSVLIGTTNPDTPTHWLMKNYIQRPKETDTKTWKFLLEENTSLPKKEIERLKTTYVGVFYDRFILGKWVAAEGLIYSKFANKKEKYIVDKIRPYDLQSIHVGIDYGASKSRTAFVAIGFTRGFRKLKDDIQLDNNTVNIDVLDAMEYAFSNYMQSLNNSFNLIESR